MPYPRDYCGTQYQYCTADQEAPPNYSTDLIFNRAAAAGLGGIERGTVAHHLTIANPFCDPGNLGREFSALATFCISTLTAWFTDQNYLSKLSLAAGKRSVTRSQPLFELNHSGGTTQIF